MTRPRVIALAVTASAVIVVIASAFSARAVGIVGALLAAVVVGLLVELRFALRAQGATLRLVRRMADRAEQTLAKQKSADRKIAALEDSVSQVQVAVRQQTSEFSGMASSVAKRTEAAEKRRKRAPWLAAVEFRQIEASMQLHQFIQPRLPVPLSRQFAASPDLLLMLVEHVVLQRPALVVECGSGASTLWMAYALQRNAGGRVVALEHDEKYAEETRSRLAAHGLEQYAEVRTAPLEQQEIDDRSWRWYAPPAWARLNDIDLLLVDGPPSTTGPLARYPAGPQLIPRMSSGGKIILDDAARGDEHKTARRWLEEFALVEHQVGSNSFDKGVAVFSTPATEVGSSVDEETDGEPPLAESLDQPKLS